MISATCVGAVCIIAKVYNYLTLVSPQPLLHNNKNICIVDKGDIEPLKAFGGLVHL